MKGNPIGCDNKMLINKAGKLITDLDFRGTKMEYLDKLTAKELFLIISATLQTVNRKETFTAKDLVPSNWEETIYEPISRACGDRAEASRLLSVVIKQALIMSPLIFRHDGGTDRWDLTVYTRV